MLNRRQLLTTGLAASVAPASSKASAQPSLKRLTSIGKARLAGIRAVGGGRVQSRASAEENVRILHVQPAGRARLEAKDELAITVDALPLLAEGVQIWRYKPWNSWTKPMHVGALKELQSDDVQLLYWRDTDGVYGAAVPLSGQGFRTTLGQIDGKLAARAAALAPNPAPADMPIMAVGHGPDPYAVIAATYRAALTAMGREDSRVEGKTMPDQFEYLGWNSWNASNLGKDCSEQLMFSAARTLKDAGVPVGWMTVDDGYFQHRDSMLLSFAPNPEKFPNGMAPMIRRLKSEFGIRYVGVWLAFNGYWHGIAPEGEVGRKYAADLFNWRELQDRVKPDSPMVTRSFVRPDRPALRRYYDEHLGARRREGFDFVKVDHQSAVERMAVNNFPLWQLASAMHEEMNRAVEKHFNNVIINCMDMTADAYLNFGRTAVARAVEDYFPYEAGETYDYQKGNAAAHVGQAIYNTLYFSQVSIPDFDMFETTNPNALMHAVARVANNGPIYVTDQPGKHDIKLIKSMALSDGRLLKADAPLLPTQDSLFILQKPHAVKAFSRVGDAGLIAAFNLADAARVTGAIKAGDVPGITSAVAYEHVTGRLEHLSAAKPIAIDLKRFGAELWTLHQPKHGFAAFGRSDKLNGHAAVKSVNNTARRATVVLHEGGPFIAYAERRPLSVHVNGQPRPFAHAKGLLRIDAPESRTGTTISIRFGYAPRRPLSRTLAK